MNMQRILVGIIFAIAISLSVKAETWDVQGGYSTHMVARKANGTVLTWGGNTYGQLGDGTTSNHWMPTPVAALSNVAAIVTAPFSEFSAVLLSNGTVRAWGQNTYGQLGNGSTTNCTTPVPVTGLSNVVALATGNTHCIALRADGLVMTWGRNNCGQLGDGTTTQHTTPVTLTSLSNVVAVSAGGIQSFAVLSNGTVWAWGYNNCGQLGDGTTNNRLSPVQIPGLTNVLMSSGGACTIAVKTDGTVWGWGSNTYGQMATNTTMAYSLSPMPIAGMSNAVSVASGVSHAMALKADGSVWTWGLNNYGQLANGTSGSTCTIPAPVNGITNVLRICGMGYDSLALRTDGTVWIWGSNSGGQFGLPANYYPAVQPLLIPELNLAAADSDSDGIFDIWETAHGLDPNNASDATSTNTEPWAYGLTNLQLFQHPSVLTADNFSTLNDGIPDWWRAKYGFSITNNLWESSDVDTDQVTNADEYLYTTDPGNPDTDGDGMMDGWEVQHGFDPIVASVQPELTATITPTPNAFGWNTNDVIVSFSVTGAVLPVITVTDNVPVTNEVSDLEVDGEAYDTAGLLATTTAYVNIDQTPPRIIALIPGQNGTNDWSNPILTVEYEDPVGANSNAVPSGLNLDTLQIMLGTDDVTTNFYRFGSGAVLSTNLAQNSYTWTVSIADYADNITTTSVTFYATGAVNTNAPTVGDLDVTDDITIMPDVSELWLQGKVGGAGSTVYASVNGGEATPMNRRDDDFGFLLPLDFGTNVIVLAARDGSGSNVSSRVVLVERSDKYQAAITGPAFGTFANGATQTITGYVSARFDDGSTNGMGLAEVKLNGQAVALGSAVNGLYAVTTCLPGTNCSVMSLVMSLCWTNGSYSTNLCQNVALGMLEGYEITKKEQHSQAIEIGYLKNEGPCYGTDLWTGYYSFKILEDYTFDLLCTLSVSNTVDSRLEWNGPDQCDSNSLAPGTMNPTNFPWVFNSDPSVSWTNVTTELQPCGPHGPPWVPDCSWAWGSLEMGEWGGSGWDGCDSNGQPKSTVQDNYQWKGEIKFRAPFQYKRNTVVVLTFERMQVNPWESTVQTPDWSQVKLLWEGTTNAPVAVAEDLFTVNGQLATNVSYIVPMDGGKTNDYTLSEASFDWPTNIWVGTDGCGNAATRTNHHLSFTGWHNGPPPHLLTDVNDDGTINDSGVVNNDPNAKPSDYLLILAGKEEFVFSNDVQEVMIAGEAPNKGKAWITYGEAIKVYSSSDCTLGSEIVSGSATSPNWDLSQTPLPAKLYVKALKVTEKGKPSPLTLNVSGVPSSTLNLAIASTVGDAAYFSCVRDYLVEKGKRVFVGDVFAKGGFKNPAIPTFKICAWRIEKSTMTVIDAQAEQLSNIDAVATKYLQTAQVMVNGTFFHEGLGYGNGTEGVVVGENGTPLAVSGTCSYGSCISRAWFAQRRDSKQYINGIGSTPWQINVQPFRAGMDALLPWLPGIPGLLFPTFNAENPSQEVSAMLHIGVANKPSDGEVMFILYTNGGDMWPNSLSGWKYDERVERVGPSGLFHKLQDSGTTLLLGLDGGGSVGVAHDNGAGSLEMKARGLRHLTALYHVNNYVLFQISD